MTMKSALKSELTAHTLAVISNASVVCRLVYALVCGVKLHEELDPRQASGKVSDVNFQERHRQPAE